MKTNHVVYNLFIYWVGGRVCGGEDGGGEGGGGVDDCLSVPSNPMTDPPTTPTPTSISRPRTSLTNPLRPVLEVNPPLLH